MSLPSPPDFRSLFESAPGLYLALDPSFVIVGASDNFLRATMTTRETIVGRNMFDVFPDNPDDPHASGVANLRASLERVMRTRTTDTMPVQKYDMRKPDSEGGGFEVRHWIPVNTPVLGPDRAVRYVIHAVTDVTDFVRLREQENMQHKAADELRTRAGQMEVEIVKRARELHDANAQLRAFQQELESRVAARTAELQRANEALRRSEDQLRQSQKLEAVGRLAGGVAHDFNNLLSVVLSYTDLLLLETGPENRWYNDLEEIRRAGQRAADLTRQMLAFSRQQVLDARILNLNEALEGVSKMLMRVVGEDIEFKTRLAPTLGKVKVDPGQLEQVIMNLVVNARDAMPHGGKLTLETANVHLDEAYASEHAGVTPGPHVMLAVSDTGIGMDKATQARIFEPFFTTKEKGKGTGLGLSTVFGIVKQSGGNIWLYSEPGGGTTFKIYFPRAEGSSDFGGTTITHSGDARGTETILLVEDEDQVRAVALGILKRAGYRVLEASNPGEAIALCEQHPAEIHLVLTDVVMPKMSGRQLATRVAVLRPAARILFMSGYTDDSVLHHGVLDPGITFLQKPLTPQTLTRKVREVLDATLRT